MSERARSSPTGRSTARACMRRSRASSVNLGVEARAGRSIPTEDGYSDAQAATPRQGIDGDDAIGACDDDSGETVCGSLEATERCGGHLSHRQ